MESKNKIQISLQKRLTDLGNKSMVAGGERIIRDFTILLQYYVPEWMRLQFGGEWIHVHVWLNPCAVHLKLSQPC